MDEDGPLKFCCLETLMILRPKLLRTTIWVTLTHFWVKNHPGIVLLLALGVPTLGNSSILGKQTVGHPTGHFVSFQ